MTICDILEPLKRQNVLLAIPKFVLDSTRNSIFDYLSQGPIVPMDVILILSRLYEIVNSFSIMRKENRNDGIFIIILQ